MMNEAVSSRNVISSSSDETETPSEITTDDLSALESDLQNEASAEDVIIEQYAQNVLDFSSQYGSDFSISYTACNITGRPSKYPDYGDFAETYAMRTYGKWWDSAPSRMPPIAAHNASNIPSQDYIVLQFEQYVLPHSIFIFETYNPGALVRIWAFTVAERWVRLWECMPQKVAANSRKFAPLIKQITEPTKIIRLEFNHSNLEYFTEIDSIMLIGKKYAISSLPEFYSAWRQGRKGPILRKLESLKFKPLIIENHEDMFNQFIRNDLKDFRLASSSTEDEMESTQIGLSYLPYEILIKILSYLDMVSLFRLSRTCRKLCDLASDPILYTEINLQPYWNLVTSNVIKTLSNRSHLIKRLDLSWVGSFNCVESADFKTFINKCGHNLTHLRLNSSKFLNPSVWELIGGVCGNLKELSIRNYTSSIPNNSGLQNLKNLERLDLFRATIGIHLLMAILKNNAKLKHLNLAFCGGLLANMDEIALHIAKYNKKIVSIDMWKNHALSSIGLTALSNCPDLEEVDFGWCLREEPSPGESLKDFLIKCTKLKKLFLASIRGLTDRDLENIAHLCPNLEQLDLMGVVGISTEKCLEILRCCPELRMLDLSFCDHLDENQIVLWRGMFDVKIIRSHVPTDSLN